VFDIAAVAGTKLDEADALRLAAGVEATASTRWRGRRLQRGYPGSWVGHEEVCPGALRCGEWIPSQSRSPMMAAAAECVESRGSRPWNPSAGPGYRQVMEELDANLVRDHIAGVELQLVESVEQQKRAEVEGRLEDAKQLQPRIDALHMKLVQIADVIAFRSEI
jgi:hypothetical protein